MPAHDDPDAIRKLLVRQVCQPRAVKAVDAGCEQADSGVEVLRNRPRPVLAWPAQRIERRFPCDNLSA